MKSYFISALLSPLAVLQVPRKTWAWVVLYLVLSSIVLGGTAWLLVHYRQDFLDALQSFLFPESWDFAVDFLTKRYLQDQQRVLLINAAVSGGLLLVTTLLFIVKEQVSNSFEREAKLVTKPQTEFPLWMQAWEEIKLFALFLGVQGTVFWIGYFPGKTNALIATTLSYLFLFFTFAIDFISPLFQRHNGYYSKIIKTLAKKPLTSLTFGGIFAAPTIVLGRLWDKHPDWSWDTAIPVLFSVNILSVVLAVIAGTWLAARLLPVYEKTRRSGIWVRRFARIAIAVLLLGNLFAFGTIGRSLLQKTQILKCDYDVHWSSFRLQKPSILGMIQTRELEVGIRFDVDITNDNSIDVRIEDNRLEVTHVGRVIATGKIAPIHVPAGESRTQTIGLKTRLSPLELRNFGSILDADAWEIVLYLKVADSFEFPVYLLHPEK